MLFLGKLDFRPNAVALALVHSRGARPRTCNTVVRGGRLTAEVAGGRGQHDDRIAVTGDVADERPYFERCTALVLPLRSGGGSRLKALVAMASGVPIVSTRLGMEGLEAEPDTHFLQADSADEWGDTLRRL